MRVQSDASLRAYFDGWQSKFGQGFQPGTAEYDRRLAIFKQNLQVRLACKKRTHPGACACSSAWQHSAITDTTDAHAQLVNAPCRAWLH